MKKEDAIQFEFNDLIMESMGFNYFTINIFCNKRVCFNKKDKNLESEVLLPCICN